MKKSNENNCLSPFKGLIEKSFHANLLGDKHFFCMGGRIMLMWLVVILGVFLAVAVVMSTIDNITDYLVHGR